MVPLRVKVFSYKILIYNFVKEFLFYTDKSPLAWALLPLRKQHNSKNAASSLLLSNMIAKLERTLRN